MIGLKKLVCAAAIFCSTRICLRCPPQVTPPVAPSEERVRGALDLSSPVAKLTRSFSPRLRPKRVHPWRSRLYRCWPQPHTKISPGNALMEQPKLNRRRGLPEPHGSPAKKWSKDLRWAKGRKEGREGERRAGRESTRMQKEHALTRH